MTPNPILFYREVERHSLPGFRPLSVYCLPDDKGGDLISYPAAFIHLSGSIQFAAMLKVGIHMQLFGVRSRRPFLRQILSNSSTASLRDIILKKLAWVPFAPAHKEIPSEMLTLARTRPFS